MRESRGYRFKTFSGVFLPSILTIIGVVLFMRLGTVVGGLGISGALVILFFAESIAIATGLSISAISTNTRVESGGPYFLISRSLGAGFGSSIGLTYFVSQSLSVPFYVLGFTEAITSCFPALGEHALLVNLIPLTLLCVISLIGANWAIKTQYLIFTLLALSVLAILAGGFSQPPSLEKLAGNWGAIPGLKVNILVFAAYFAIFFPAVTGFLSGVNMSGDLENPRKSIPRGTMTAIGVGFVLYAVVIILVGAAYERIDLIADAYKTLYNGAVFHTGILILAGVIAATLSSALGTIVGAPRILQAFAADKIFPVLNFFSYGRGKAREPVPAMLLTFLISVATIVWGTFAAKNFGGNALNAVAKLVTMFTLSTYAIINIAAAVEDFADNPSFRPQFHFYHWVVGVYGAIASFAVALFIDAVVMVIAFAIIGILFFIARRRTLHATFGDARRGYYFEHIRRALIHLSAMPVDTKNWRPEFLVLVGGEKRHLDLIYWASLLNNDRGILSVGRIVSPETKSPEDARKKRREVKQQLVHFSQQSGILFFPTVVTTPDESVYDYALLALLQSRDFGPLTPNIILSGWPRSAERIPAFARRMLVISHLRMNNLIFFPAETDPSAEGETIDIWWRGRRNGALMLILAHLLNRSWQFRKKTIRVLRLVDPENQSTAKRDLVQLVDDARIQAETAVVASREGFPAVFRKYSSCAAVIFLGFITPEEENAPNFYNSTNALLKSMPATFLVSSTGDTDVDS